MQLAPPCGESMNEYSKGTFRYCVIVGLLNRNFVWKEFWLVMILRMYKCLCFLRILLIFIPQIGYIHPDEHFQASEIINGDIFEFKVYRPWEFTCENPIRTIVLPYFIVGIPSLISSWLGIMRFHRTETFPYLIIVFPRLVMCCLSFLHDFFLYKICLMMKKSYEPCLTLFASSYVTIIYFTRTFSNSLEAVFFTFTIYIICKLLYLYGANDAKSCFLHISRLYYESYTLGIIFGIGFFNRPTFVCYTLLPLAVWLYIVLKFNTNIRNKLEICIIFSLAFICISICLITIDSFYYNKAHYTDLNDSLKIWKDIVCTPLNFILYNTSSKNLDVHGIHPRWLHAFVNIPLLFSINGIILIVKAFTCLSKKSLKSRFYFVKYLSLLFLLPLFFLSAFPHQEPRFIIPLIIPFVLLLTDYDHFNILSNSLLIKIWFSHNILAAIFYGFLHQSGMFLSLSYIHHSLQSHNNSAIIYFKMYMPPRYLLGITQTEKGIEVYDFAGVDLKEFKLSIKNIALHSKPRNMYIIVPYDISVSLNFSIQFLENYQLIKTKQIFPHLSTENLPKWDNIFDNLSSNSSLLYRFLGLKEMFSVYIFIFEYQYLHISPSTMKLLSSDVI